MVLHEEQSSAWSGSKFLFCGGIGVGWGCGARPFRRDASSENNRSFRMSMIKTVDGLVAIAEQVQSTYYPNRSGSFVEWGLARGNFAFGSLTRVGQSIQFRECQDLCVATFDSSDDSELNWTELGHFRCFPKTAKELICALFFEELRIGFAWGVDVEEIPFDEFEKVTSGHDRLWIGTTPGDSDNNVEVFKIGSILLVRIDSSYPDCNKIHLC
jgi:hypothetical protein